MQLDDLNKIPLNYMFSYTLAAIYKISLNDEYWQNLLYSEYFKTEEVLFILWNTGYIRL